jgi:hypothetical protein
MILEWLNSEQVHITTMRDDLSPVALALGAQFRDWYRQKFEVDSILVSFNVKLTILVVNVVLHAKGP